MATGPDGSDPEPPGEWELVPFIDLNTPTELLFQWGWLLVTRANALVYLLLVAVFLVGVFVRLPGERPHAPVPAPAAGAGTGAVDGEEQS